MAAIAHISVDKDDRIAGSGGFVVKAPAQDFQEARLRNDDSLRLGGIRVVVYQREKDRRPQNDGYGDREPHTCLLDRFGVRAYLLLESTATVCSQPTVAAVIIADLVVGWPDVTTVSRLWRSRNVLQWKHSMRA